MNTGTTNRQPGLIGRLIAVCVRHPVATIVITLAACVWGWYSLRNAPLDAVPDLSDAQVIILTEWPGRSPDLVEDQITYPISSALLAAPGVKFVRGQSYFGTSFVYVVFEDGTDIYWARSRVLEYLNAVTKELPDGVTPSMGPDATAIGWVFQYALVDTTGGVNLADLRSLQDWHVRYALESVDGVAEVATVGGFVKQYQVNVDPDRLRSYGIPLPRVIEAVRAANQDVGGRVIEIAGHEHMIRGRGYIKSTTDLEASVLATGKGGVPVRIADVATVTLGPDIRRGVAELDGRGEVVGGVVIMRYGENALRVIDAVKERIDDVRAGLPDGVELKIVYDRSDLIERSVRTLWHTLAEEMIVVSLIIFLFLMHVRSALVAIITLPVAVLLAFIPMFYQNLTINIMSLGGIAVAIGAMVDASIIIVENVHRRLEKWDESNHTADSTHHPASRRDVVVSAVTEVGPSIFFSLVVIAVGFLPVFTLEATEGRLFRPLAFTKTYSMGFAAVLAVTLAPALAALLIRGRMRREESNPLTRWLIRAYEPVVRWVVRWRYAVVVVFVLILAGTIPVFLALESEFMPPLNEGAILAMPTSPPGMSVTEAANVVQTMDRVLSEFPEVESVFGKMGRAETATDPAPLSMAEITIMLKPRDEWRPGMTWDKLIDEMDAAVQVPGMPNLWWMPIQTRIEMLTTGIRSPLGIQVFGPDLETIEQTAVDIERAVMDIRGTRSAFAERSTGGFFIDFTVKRDTAARYGLSVRDINMIVQSAIGGMNVTQTVEGRERYPVNVRFAREWRDHPEALERVVIHTPTGEDIPISLVADI
ncbi:MAG: efflux RND transporter permease subunit, partial [Candidatus Latescibacterota bacterium]